MKKTIGFMLIFMLLFCGVTAHALEVEPGETVSVAIRLGAHDAMMWNCKVSYDQNVLEYVGWQAGISDQFDEASKTFIGMSGNSGGTVGMLEFKVKGNAKAGQTTVSASATGINMTESTEFALSASGASITILAVECNHSWDDGVDTTAATCEADGLKTYTCTKCEETKTEKIDALGHKAGEAVVTKEATCTAVGEGTIACTACGKVIETKEIPVKAHTPNAEAETVQPTCTEDGYTTGGKCTVCGEVLDKEVLPATGHKDDGGKETKAAICTEKGEKTYTCTVCDKVVKTEEIAALGHKDDGGKETKAATCTEMGEKIYTCTVCKEVVKTEEIAALGHKPGEWVIVKEATKEEDGYKERYCTVCNELVDAQVIPHAQWYHMTVSSAGIRFRDVGEITDKWHMFTPVDLSVDGEQTFDLVAGNKHVVGTVYVKVADGQATVTYKTISGVEVQNEFLTFFVDLASVTTLDESQLTGYAFGEPINIEEQLGGDTKVLLYIHGNTVYRDDARGLMELPYLTNAYKQYVEDLKAIMD